MPKLSTIVSNINDTQTIEENVYILANCVDESYKNAYGSREIKCKVSKGRKYYKLTFDHSVHCFVDVKNGNVYKAASYNKPAKHVRYNLLDDVSRQSMFEKAHYAGGYLYLKWLI